MYIIGWVEFLSEFGTERAVCRQRSEPGAEDHPSPQPAHLMRFVHPAVHQEIGCPIGGAKMRHHILPRDGFGWSPGDGAAGVIEEA
jgi:hypothetical protein